MSTITIWRAFNGTGWLASFQGVAGMPHDTLPLPFTAAAFATTVAADMVRRFPDAEVYFVDYDRRDIHRRRAVYEMRTRIPPSRQLTAQEWQRVYSTIAAALGV